MSFEWKHVEFLLIKIEEERQQLKIERAKLEVEREELRQMKAKIWADRRMMRRKLKSWYREYVTNDLW